MTDPVSLFFGGAHELRLTEDERSRTRKSLRQYMAGNPVRNASEVCQRKRMQSSLEAFAAEARNFSLSTEEKSSLYEKLTAHMTLHPRMAQEGAAGGALHASLHPGGRFRSSGFDGLLKRAVAAAGAFALVGASVAYAAESSLPGDFLYPVKVDVSEPVRSSFDFTTRRQAERALWQSERRLEEISELIALGRFTPTNAAEISGRLRNQTALLRDRLNRLSATGETQSATAIGARLESTLDAHEEVLKNLALRTPAASAADTVVAEVHGEAQAVLRQRLVTQAALDRQGRGGMEDAARQSIQAADDAIQDAKTFLERISRTNVSTARMASLRVTVAGKMLNDANVRMSEKSFTQAFTLSQSALRLAKQAELAGRVGLTESAHERGRISGTSEHTTAAQGKADVKEAMESVDALRSLVRRDHHRQPTAIEAEARLTSATEALQEIGRGADAQVLLEEAKRLTDDARTTLELKNRSDRSDE